MHLREQYERAQFTLTSTVGKKDAFICTDLSVDGRHRSTSFLRILARSTIIQR